MRPSRFLKDEDAKKRFEDDRGYRSFIGGCLSTLKPKGAQNAKPKLIFRDDHDDFRYVFY